MKKVTIIVPVYNVENYLEKCVDSLINQTYNNLEIVLVNDGATDNSGLICDEYVKKDSRIKVIHKKNGGLSDARNFGLKNCTGDYIIFLDSDDYVEPNLVESAIECANSNDSDVVIYGFHTDFYTINDTLEKTIPAIPKKENYDKSNIDELSMDDDFFKVLGYAWNKMYKAEIIKENNFEFIKGISLVEDMLFNVPVLIQAKNISFLDLPLVHYIQRNEITLGNKLYSDYDELKIINAEAIKTLLLHWNNNEKYVDEVYNQLIFNSIKGLLSSIATHEDMSKNNKIEFFSKIISNKKYQSTINNITLKSLKDKFIRKLLQSKKYRILISLYDIKN